MPAQQIYQKPQTQTENPHVFSLRTHKFNARGHLVSRNLYRLHIKDGTKYFERPVNSGNLFYENNDPAGRVEFVVDEKTKRKVKKFDFAAEHVEYRAPLVGAEKLVAELEDANKALAEERAKTATILAELEAIRADQAKINAQLAKNEKPAQSVQAPAKVAVQAAPNLAQAAGPGSENL